MGVLCYIPYCTPLIVSLTVYFIFKNNLWIKENLINQDENNKRFRKDISSLNISINVLQSSIKKLNSISHGTPQKENIQSIERRNRNDLHRLKRQIVVRSYKADSKR